MRRLLVLVVVLFELLLPVLAGLAGLRPEAAWAAQWGSQAYGDPPDFCPDGSLLPATVATVVSNDPSVGSNPEQDTFWGVHSDPGYDDWYGRWYGDFAGTPGQDSGWAYIGTSYYGQPPLHWNFASFGWQVHGHAKQYIAYYNWTFGGSCGMGWWGSDAPPPYMADVYGYPVVDIYVDAVPPDPPLPRVTAIDQSSVTFTWDPVADRGDGAGPDLFAVGGVHYQSWIEGGPSAGQWADTASPRMLTASGLGPGQQACVHVIALDALGNATPDQVACAATFTPPPAPAPPPPSAVLANPAPTGLAGLDAWFWLAPAPVHHDLTESAGGFSYQVALDPVSVSWDYGDGGRSRLAMPAGAGTAFPASSPVRHVFGRQSAAGYTVGATVTYAVTWRVLAIGTWLGPYPAADLVVPQSPLAYPVMQAQPELAPSG